MTDVPQRGGWQSLVSRCRDGSAVRHQAGGHSRALGIRVVLAGQRTDVLDLLPAFDIFAMASRYEGLPTVIIEAMICGVPVVATAVNAVSDVVVPGETGILVPPQRPELLAAAIRYLLDAPAAAARMAALASARVAGRYGEPALHNALMAAYSRAPSARGYAYLPET